MGENLAAKRWSTKQKKVIEESRVESTKILVSAINNANKTPPKFFISASAIGFYPLLDGKEINEDQGAGDNYLASVCKNWEESSSNLNPSIRRVLMRIGVVLTDQGGAFDKMSLPFKIGAGGRLGSGKQWMSWIHLEDLVTAFTHAIKTESLAGPVNTTAPESIQNKEFSKLLAKSLIVLAYSQFLLLHQRFF